MPLVVPLAGVSRRRAASASQPGCEGREGLEAAINAEFEITVPLRPLDLLNDMKPRLWSVSVAFFRGPDGELIELLEDETGYT